MTRLSGLPHKKGGHFRTPSASMGCLRAGEIMVVVFFVLTSILFSLQTVINGRRGTW